MFNLLRGFSEYPRRESNPNRRNRNPKFYPLNYGNKCTAKVSKISVITKENASLIPKASTYMHIIDIYTCKYDIYMYKVIVR